MDNILYELQQPKKRIRNIGIKATVIAILFFSAAMVLCFSVIGAYTVAVSAPEHKKTIKALNLRIETLSATIDVLNNTLSEERERYTIANRWGTLFDMICDTDEKIRFDMVEDYLAKNNGLYKLKQ